MAVAPNPLNETQRVMTDLQVAIELAGAAKEARAKHGDQRHLPMGTGPNWTLLRDLAIESQDLFILDLDNEDLAETAKRSCDAAAERDDVTWQHIITEEWAEAMAEEDPAALRAELLQLGAMAISAIVALDHQQAEA